MLIVITTTDNYEIATKLANALLDNKAAACVQIKEVQSFYKWENQTKNNKEYKLSIKTADSKYKAVEKIVLSIHNYQLPEIIAIKVEKGLQGYINWIDEECI